MPRIEAEENLRWVSVNLMGSGMLKKSAFDRQIRQWRRIADGPRPATKPEELMRNVQRAGIVVVNG